LLTDAFGLDGAFEAMTILPYWRPINNPPPRVERTAPADYTHRGRSAILSHRVPGAGPQPRIATAYKKIEGRSCDRAPTFWLLAPRDPNFLTPDHKAMHVCCAKSLTDRIVCWCPEIFLTMQDGRRFLSRSSVKERWQCLRQ
jgi:hypothetical protein